MGRNRTLGRSLPYTVLQRVCRLSWAPTLQVELDKTRESSLVGRVTTKRPRRLLEPRLRSIHRLFFVFVDPYMCTRSSYNTRIRLVAASQKNDCCICAPLTHL